MPRKTPRADTSRQAVPNYKRLPHKLLPYDPVFFRIVDVFKDQTLVCKGRTVANTHWKVIRITTDLGLGRGSKRVDRVEHLTDMVEMRCVEHPHLWKTTTFGYLSYSGIWRMPDDYAPPRFQAVD